MKLTFLMMAVSVAAAPAPEAHPVCIVGAGPAGLMAANGLEAKGYSTVIFEKDPEVGGKCQEYYEGWGLLYFDCVCNTRVNANRPPL